MLMYTACEDDWPGETRDSACERILNGLEKIMELSIAESFNSPVEVIAFPDYFVLISYPIDLSTIKTRLESRFYRRLHAVKWDMRKIWSNAEQFNEPNSDIVRHAFLLTKLLLEFITDPHCTNPIPIWKRLQKMASSSSSQNIASLIGDIGAESGDDGDDGDQQLSKNRGKTSQSAAATATAAAAAETISTTRSSGRTSRANSKFDKPTTSAAATSATAENINDRSSRHAARHAPKGRPSSRSATVQHIMNTSSSSHSAVKPNSSNTKSKNTSNHERSAGGGRSEDRQSDWKEMCRGLIRDLMRHNDSGPFRTPVDLGAYSDYLKFVSRPIDLGTIQRKLKNGEYGDELATFDADCKLIFSNSKAYNTDKRSKVS